MRSKLIILTDLWGNINSNWIKVYAENLKDKFEVKIYSCCEIAEIDSFEKTEKEIHSEFIKSGIEKAVENLLKLEKEEINILAFSVGGIIAWKSEIKGLKIRNLKAISSTRLRNEINKPNCNLKLYFGENDDYKPKKEWFENLNVNYEIVKNAEHKVYENLDFAKKVCKNINRNW
jgi:esterase/lipase